MPTPPRRNPLRRAIPRAILRLAIPLIACLAHPAAATAADLTHIPNATIAEADANDGDSFRAIVDGKPIHLRLYFVDTPETIRNRIALPRLREQQRHFGLPDLAAVIDYGEQAAAYTRRVLAPGFAIHTSYARAPGLIKGGRYYAFVTTIGGQDLAHLLIQHGLARIHGTTRQAPDGTPDKTIQAQLQDIQAAAMLKRTGIWKTTDPDLLIKLRQQSRAEQAELTTALAPKPGQPINLNTATSKQLQRLKGIGPKTATSIITHRPYRSRKDLLKVPGIGPKTLNAITPHITTDKE